MIATFAELRTALDYLPVAVRAADRNPDNDTLWAEAIRAQRAVLDYADTHLDGAEAADVQATVGTIANIAVWSDEYAHAHGVEWSARAKRHVLVLTGAIDSFADMTNTEVTAYLAGQLNPGHLDIAGTRALVKELRRRGTVPEGVFWWLVGRARSGDL